MASKRELGVQKLRIRLGRFYREHNKSKLTDIDKVATCFYGRESKLNAALLKTYKADLNSVANPSTEVIHRELKLRLTLRQFYEIHNKDKLEDADRVLTKFFGKEEKLNNALKKTYSKDLSSVVLRGAIPAVVATSQPEPEAKQIRPIGDSEKLAKQDELTSIVEKKSESKIERRDRVVMEQTGLSIFADSKAEDKAATGNPEVKAKAKTGDEEEQAESTNQTSKAGAEVITAKVQTMEEKDAAVGPEPQLLPAIRSLSTMVEPQLPAIDSFSTMDEALISKVQAWVRGFRERIEQRKITALTLSEQLVAFYKVYAPDELDAVPDVIARFNGDRNRLNKALLNQYGVDLSALNFRQLLLGVPLTIRLDVFYRIYDPAKVGTAFEEENQLALIDEAEDEGELALNRMLRTRYDGHDLTSLSCRGLEEMRKEAADEATNYALVHSPLSHQLMAFYEIYAPDKMPSVRKTTEYYKGVDLEAELNTTLTRLYGVGLSSKAARQATKESITGRLTRFYSLHNVGTWGKQRNEKRSEDEKPPPLTREEEEKILAVVLKYAENERELGDGLTSKYGVGLESIVWMEQQLLEQKERKEKAASSGGGLAGLFSSGAMNLVAEMKAKKAQEEQERQAEVQRLRRERAKLPDEVDGQIEMKKREEAARHAAAILEAKKKGLELPSSWRPDKTANQHVFECMCIKGLATRAITGKHTKTTKNVVFRKAIGNLLGLGYEFVPEEGKVEKYLKATHQRRVMVAERRRRRAAKKQKLRRLNSMSSNVSGAVRSSGIGGPDSPNSGSEYTPNSSSFDPNVSTYSAMSGVSGANSESTNGTRSSSRRRKSSIVLNANRVDLESEEAERQRKQREAEEAVEIELMLDLQEELDAEMGHESAGAAEVTPESDGSSIIPASPSSPKTNAAAAAREAVARADAATAAAMNFPSMPLMERVRLTAVCALAKRHATAEEEGRLGELQAMDMNLMVMLELLDNPGTGHGEEAEVDDETLVGAAPATGAGAGPAAIRPKSAAALYVEAEMLHLFEVEMRKQKAIPEADIRQYLNRQFHVFDVDRSTKLSKEELLALLQGVELRLSEEHAIAVSKRLDTAKDGSVGLTEFVQSTPKAIQRVFELEDEQEDEADNKGGPEEAAAKRRMRRRKRASLTPNDWVELPAGDGSATCARYWYNKRDGRSQWSRPTELPTALAAAAQKKPSYMQEDDEYERERDREEHMEQMPSCAAILHMLTATEMPDYERMRTKMLNFVNGYLNAAEERELDPHGVRMVMRSNMDGIDKGQQQEKKKQQEQQQKEAGVAGSWDDDHGDYAMDDEDRARREKDKKEEEGHGEMPDTPTKKKGTEPIKGKLVGQHNIVSASLY
jgi:hypothetical protein